MPHTSNGQLHHLAVLPEGRHRQLPAVVHAADHVRLRAAGIGEPGMLGGGVEVATLLGSQVEAELLNE